MLNKPVPIVAIQNDGFPIATSAMFQRTFIVIYETYLIHVVVFSRFH